MNPTQKKKENKSLTVAAARAITAAVLLSPAGENKAVLFPNAHLMTPNAQNALLKIIEEPPANVHFYFQTPEKSAILPTIISRSEIIHPPRTTENPTSQAPFYNDLNKATTTFLQTPSARNKYKLEQFILAQKEQKAEILSALEEILSVFLQDSAGTQSPTPKSIAESNISPITMLKRTATAKSMLKSNCNWSTICFKLVS